MLEPIFGNEPYAGNAEYEKADLYEIGHRKGMFHLQSLGKIRECFGEQEYVDPRTTIAALIGLSAFS